MEQIFAGKGKDSRIQVGITNTADGKSSVLVVVKTIDRKETYLRYIFYKEHIAG